MRSIMSEPPQEEKEIYQRDFLCRCQSEGRHQWNQRIFPLFLLLSVIAIMYEVFPDQCSSW